MVEQQIRELVKNRPVEIKLIQADFCGNSKVEYYTELKAKIEALRDSLGEPIDVAVWILNAGLNYFGNLEVLTPQEAERTLDVDLYQYGALTKVCYDLAQKRELQAKAHGYKIKRTGLLSTCSGMCFNYYPGCLIYSASKVFVMHLNTALTFEQWKGPKKNQIPIDVFAYTPLGLATNMLSGLTMPDAIPTN